MMENSAQLAYFIHRAGHCMKDVIKILFILGIGGSRARLRLCGKTLRVVLI